MPCYFLNYCAAAKKWLFFEEFLFFTVFWLDSEHNLLSGISANVDYNRFAKDEIDLRCSLIYYSYSQMACTLLPFSDKLIAGLTPSSWGTKVTSKLQQTASCRRPGLCLQSEHFKGDQMGNSAQCFSPCCVSLFSFLSLPLDIPLLVLIN